MAATPQHIYQFANILKRRTSSDEELYTKIKDMMVFADERFDAQQFESRDAGNPVWFAVRSSDLVGLLLNIAANGEKNEGTFTKGTPLNHARVIAIWRLSQIVSRLDFKLYANKDLAVDLIQRVPRILKIYEKAIQGQDPPGEVAPSRLPLLFIVGSLAELDTLKTIDKSFTLLKCNLETMAWLVFTPFFGDQKLSFGKAGFDAECGGNIIRSYYDVGINLNTRIMDEAISRFGISRIVQQSIRLCKMTGASEITTMLGTRVLILNLMEDSRFHDPLILRGRVHRILVDRFWDCNRNYDLEHDELSGRSCDVVNTLNRILGYLTDDRLQEFIVQDLVMHHDLLLLLARVALWADEEAPMAGSVKVIMDAIVAHCQRPSRQLESQLRNDWLYGSHCLQTYLSPDRSQFSTLRRITFRPVRSIEQWKTFGTRLNIPLIAQTSYHPVVNDDQHDSHTGCFWVRCPLFGERLSSQTPSSLFSCTCCKQTMYCSLQCQKRDWKEGNHRKVCRSPQ